MEIKPPALLSPAPQRVPYFEKGERSGERRRQINTSFINPHHRNPCSPKCDFISNLNRKYICIDWFYLTCEAQPAGFKATVSIKCNQSNCSHHKTRRKKETCQWCKLQTSIKAAAAVR